MPRKRNSNTSAAHAERKQVEPPRRKRKPRAVSTSAERAETASSTALAHRVASQPNGPRTDTAVIAASAGNVAAVTKVISLEPGLFAIDVSLPKTPPLELAQLSFPLIWLSHVASSAGDRAKIMTDAETDELWFGGEGGLVVVRAPAGGAQLRVTAFLPSDKKDVAPDIVVQRLARAALRQGGLSMEQWEQARLASEAGVATSPRDVELEIMLHIERQGDRRSAAPGWFGNLGGKLRVEGFSIRPLVSIAPYRLQYKAFYAGGAETQWAESPQYCGTRGRRLPLTGFCIRLVPDPANQFLVEYRGAFFRSGIRGPFKNGMTCTAALADDPLEAIAVRLVDNRE
jgi:hypothetical protein